MASNPDDVDDEYVDDPISLVPIDDIKKEICEEDQIININSSSDEEEVYTSAYGKKNIVLPVTFFDNTRNIRLLNKCKPMSINIVDCKQYPTYYSKHEEKTISKSDKSSVEIDNKDRSDSENKPKSGDAQNVVSTIITVPEADSKQEGEKKRRVRRSHCHSFYEKYKTRKENSKQRALDCKDLSQVDFKRNTGLVGLKITDTAFKQIVNTEKTIIRTKKDQAENKSKEINENDAEKQLITEKKDAPTKKFNKNFECDVEKALSEIFGNKSKENKKSDTEKEPVVAESTDYTTDKFKEKSENAVDKSFVENRCKDNTEKYGEKTLSSTNITSAKDKTKDSKTYIKQVSATLDNFGTSIIPVTDIHTNNVVSNNLTVTETIENKSITTHKNLAAFIEKLGDNHDIAIRCSLTIPSKKIVEKVLQLKEVKSQSKSALHISQNTIVQQSLKETMNKSQTVSKFGIKSYKGNIDDVIPEKDKLQCKEIDKHVAYSRKTKQVEKPMGKYASKKDQPGSPVIPCTTIPNFADQNMSKTNLTKETNQVNTPIKSASFSGNAVQINNQTTNGLIKNQNYPQMSPSPNPMFSGHNAIIFSRPLLPASRDSPNHAPPNQGQHIQTVINYRPRYQPMPNGPTPIRFRFPPPPPPPNYPPPPPNYSSPPSNFAQIRPNQIFMPPNRMRGIGIGIHKLLLGPRPPGCRSPLPIPPIQRQDNLKNNLRPPTPQVNNDSFIGNNANGDPIKKIHIPPPPPPSLLQTSDTVNDKQMMLAELNNAMMSPELTTNKQEEKPIGDLKRTADPKPTIEPVKPKYSKPCPLSKKSYVATDAKVPNKPVSKVEYSPPILPIPTYEESFELFSQNDTNIKEGVPDGKQNYTPSKSKCSANIIKIGSNNKKRTRTNSGKQGKAKKISFEDYRKRAKDGADRIDVDIIRRPNGSKNVTDDYNQDLGYDSDSTVKL